jgi:hypothetical protein
MSDCALLNIDELAYRSEMYARKTVLMPCRRDPVGDSVSRDRALAEQPAFIL